MSRTGKPICLSLRVIADVEREKWKNGIFPFPSRGEQKRFNTSGLVPRNLYWFSVVRRLYPSTAEALRLKKRG